jgi:hypothetical protein
MQTIKLEIEDSKVDIVLNIIKSLKSDIIQKYEVIKQNNYTNSKEFSENKAYFKEALKKIDTERLIPLNEGLDEIDECIESL